MLSRERSMTYVENFEIKFFKVKKEILIRYSIMLKETPLRVSVYFLLVLLKSVLWEPNFAVR